MIITRGVYNSRTGKVVEFSIPVEENPVISVCKREADEVQLALNNLINGDDRKKAEQWADKMAFDILAGKPEWAFVAATKQFQKVAKMIAEMAREAFKAAMGVNDFADAWSQSDIDLTLAIANQQQMSGAFTG